MSTPPQTNLVQWYNCSLGGAYKDAGMTVPCTVDNDLIYALKDLSPVGTNHLLQATAGARPKWRINDGTSINGYPLAGFDGVDDFMDCVGIVIAQPSTSYLAMKFVAEAADLNAFMDGRSGINQRVAQIKDGTGQIRIYSGTILGPTVDTALGVNTWGRFCAVFNDTASLIRVNDAAAVTGAAGTNGADGFTLGSNPSGSNPVNVYVAELLTYSVAHNTAEQNAVMLYLKNKYFVAPNQGSFFALF